MRLYHTTPAAAAIMRDGFRDGTGTYLTTHVWTGVWLADQPLDSNEGAEGDDVIIVEIPEEAIADYEWVEEGKPYREWLVPAMVINAYSRECITMIEAWEAKP